MEHVLEKNLDAREVVLFSAPSSFAEKMLIRKQLKQFFDLHVEKRAHDHIEVFCKSEDYESISSFMTDVIV